MFEEAFEKIGSAIQDVTTLSVTTYTGTLSRVDAEALSLKALAEGGGLSGDLKIVAKTEMKIDGDALLFISAENDIGDKLEAHKEAVGTAEASRRATFQLFREAIHRATDKLARD